MTTETPDTADQTKTPPVEATAQETKAEKFYADDKPKAPAAVDPKVPSPAEGEKKAPVVEDKKDEKAPVSEDKKVEPVKFDLKLPEHSMLKPEHVKEVEAYALEAGLTSEQAQKVLERDNQLMVTKHENDLAFIETKKDEWRSLSLADPEVGGDNHKQSIHYAHQAIQRFGSDKLKDELNNTGFGDHPEVVRVFSKIGKAMANDTFVRAGTQPVAKRSREEILYDNNKEGN